MKLFANRQGKRMLAFVLALTVLLSLALSNMTWASLEDSTGSTDVLELTNVSVDKTTIQLPAVKPSNWDSYAVTITATVELANGVTLSEKPRFHFDFGLVGSEDQLTGCGDFPAEPNNNGTYALSVSIPIDYSWQAGEYELKRVMWLEADNQVDNPDDDVYKSVAFSDNITFTVDRSLITDHTGPVVSAVDMTVDGSAADKAVKGTNSTVEIHVTAADETAVENVVVVLKNNAAGKDMGIEAAWTNNGSEYIASVNVADLDLGEWYVSECIVQDVYMNETRLDVSKAGVQVYDASGNTAEETYTYWLSFVTMDETGEYTEETVRVSSGRTVDLSDVLEANDYVMPEDPSFEGLTFEGWYEASNKKCLTANDDTFYLNTNDIQEDYTIWLTPQYDKAVFAVDIHYLDENNEYVDYQYIYSDGVYGTTTVQNMVDRAMQEVGTITHSTDVVFQQWKEYGPSCDEILTPEFASIGLHAEYDKMVQFVEYSYYNEDGEEVWETATVYMPKSATGTVTAGEIVKYFIDNETTSIQHYEEFGEVTWVLDEYMDPSEEIGENGRWVSVHAEYENEFYFNTYVEITFRDETLEHIWVSAGINADGTTTYQDLIDEMMAEVDHSDALTFIDWKTYVYVDDEQVTNFDFDTPVEKYNVGIEVRAQYKETVAGFGISYYDANGDWVEEGGYFVVEEGSTFQNVVDKLDLSANVNHYADADFVDWTYYLFDKNYIPANLTDIIEGASVEIFISANYNKYPIEYVYYYLDNNGEVVQKSEAVLVAAGDNILSYFDTLTLPTGAIRWGYLDVLDYEVSGNFRRVVAAACYADKNPVYISMDYVDMELDLQNLETVLYVPVTYDKMSDWEEYMRAIAPEVEKLVPVVPNGFTQTGLTLDWVDSGRVEISMDESRLIYNMGVFYTRAVYDKSVVYLEYPDGYTETVVVDFESKYELPSEYKGKDIYWDGYLDTDGKVIVDEPVVWVYAEYEVPPVELEPEKIDAVVEKVAEAEEGTTVIVDMTTQTTEDGKVATMIPGVVLEEIKGRDVTVEFQMGNSYSWVINGKDLAEFDGLDRDLEVILIEENKSFTVPESVVNSVAKDKDTALQITLTYSGSFGFPATLKINVGTDLAGKIAELFYYNNDNGNLEQQKDRYENTTFTIDSDGFMQLPFNHASDYIVVISNEAESSTPAEDSPEPENSTPAEESPEAESSTPTDDSSEAESSTPAVDDSSVTVGSDNIDTGDYNQPAMYVMIMVVAVVGLTIMIAMKKRSSTNK